jgi:hypothetical protein
MSRETTTEKREFMPRFWSKGWCARETKFVLSNSGALALLPYAEATR